MQQRKLSAQLVVELRTLSAGLLAVALAARSQQRLPSVSDATLAPTKVYALAGLLGSMHGLSESHS